MTEDVAGRTEANILLSHLGKTTMVIRYGFARWHAPARRRWVLSLKAAALSTVRECNDWLENHD